MWVSTGVVTRGCLSVQEWLSLIMGALTRALHDVSTGEGSVLETARPLSQWL